MTTGHSSAACLLFPLLVLSAFLAPALATKSYVVFLTDQNQGARLTSQTDVDSVLNSHYNVMSAVLGSVEEAQQSIIYSYSRYLNGFAAVMNDDQAEQIAKNPNVLSVLPNRVRKLHTTRSWQFLGLEKDDGEAVPGSTWEQARYGEDTIIANLDTGVWPESASFNDEGLGPIPLRWKGTCQQGVIDKFPCNRKLIGGKAFFRGYIAEGGHVTIGDVTARDTEGHGSHSLSTAGGSFVPNVNIHGFANGTAMGGSPRARVAAYKVCWPALTPDGGGCFDADILAGFEAAIADGVDVISVSLGGEADEFYADGIAIGSFHAVSNGITVIASGGNAGPFPETIRNNAPWLFTVAASTFDRMFPAYVALGNRIHLKGTSFCSKGLPRAKFYPLMTARDAQLTNTTDFEAELCKPGTLDPSQAKGKILICHTGETTGIDKGKQVLEAGGVGMILVNDVDGEDISPEAHVLPASEISYADSITLFKYYKSTVLPTAFITKGTTEIGNKPAPIVAAFSSRGPNTVDPAILKPDITAPGVDVLAAYTQVTDPSVDPRPYNLMSGTSMACPHVSGIVGLLKTAHPDWSPAAIRSALMTTAVTRDNKREKILDSNFQKATPFDYGAGQVQPNQALDPGLVYDLGKYDYMNYLCGRGYSMSLMATFSKEPYTCPPKFSILNFNYPSITVPKLSQRTEVTRRVKNVGVPGKYVVRVRQPAGAVVGVWPSELVFEKVGEEKEFVVVLRPRIGAKRGEYGFGSIVWSDGKHIVRSPLLVKLP